MFHDDMNNERVLDVEVEGLTGSFVTSDWVASFAIFAFNGLSWICYQNLSSNATISALELDPIDAVMGKRLCSR